MMASRGSCRVYPMHEVAEEISDHAWAVADHAWAWADVMAWCAGTLGSVCVVMAERFFNLEDKLSPH